MTPLLRTLALWAAAVLLAASAHAQVLRPSQSPYVLLRGSLATYTGDLDNDPDNSPFDLSDGFDEPGFGVGGELGYLFNENLSFGLGFVYQDLPALEDDGNEGEDAYQIQGLFRYLPFSSALVTPYLELGGALVFGQGTEDERGNGDADDNVVGYGPVVGLGLDLALTPRLGLFLGGQSTVVFPDVALDGADPGAFDDDDDADFDILTNLGGGLRFAFRSPVQAPEITRLECPATLTTGDTGSFLVTTDGDGSTAWEWGDGTTSAGATTVHRFTAPGTYTVTATSSNRGGSDAESCLVEVVDPRNAPTLSGCRASTLTADVGEEVTFYGVATDADDVLVDFGDGSMASELPVRHAFDRSGTYRVTLTARSDAGQDSCEFTVTVGDAYCQSVSELSAVNFEYGATRLTNDALSRLDESIEILRRCPDLCVTINGYSDGSEPGNALRTSQARANAVLDYYVAQGIDGSRLRAVGRGVDPAAEPKEDPAPGDRLARRVDSIPGSCAGF